MKKLNFVAIFLAPVILLLGCNNYNPKKDNIIFRYQHHIVADFKAKTIEVKMIKYNEVLTLSKEEENEIYSAFNRNRIDQFKGEVIVSDSLPITPIIYSEFKIYHEGTLKSSLLINEDYNEEQNSAEEKDRVADFRDIVKRVLMKNKSFKLAKDSLDRYFEENNMFYL